MRSTIAPSLCGIIVLGSASFFASSAQAQFSPRTFVENYIYNRPTVSPYVNLVRRDGFSSALNYQTIVRPQLEAREVARIQQAELNRLEQQIAVQQRTFETAPPRQREQRVFSTGHPTRFMNVQQYYPGFSQLRQ